MNLTHQTYRSGDADREYMSFSQFKRFAECPAKACAELNGTWTEEPSKALKIGSYVDCALLTPELFDAYCRANVAEIMQQSGKAKLADFMLADKMIARCRRDPAFMSTLTGEHQRIITWEMFGAPWKMMADTIDAEDVENIVECDLKTCADLEKTQWDADRKQHVPWYESYGYWLQRAIYAEGIKSVYGVYPALSMIAAVSKDDFPRLQLLAFTSRLRMDRELEQVKALLPDILAMKRGEKEARRCEQCDFCAHTRAEAPLIAAKDIYQCDLGVTRL